MNKTLVIDLLAVSKTIIDYSTDNFIINYASLITQKNVQEDIDTFKYVLRNLIEWYKNEIIKIEKSEFIYNKDAHLKSFKILTELFNSINL